VRRHFPVAMVFVVLTTMSASSQQLQSSQPQELQSPRAGRGLLPGPSETPKALEAVSSNPFKVDESGLLSRTIFETDEGSSFKVIIREFSIPPDRQPHVLRLPSALLVEPLGEAEVKVDGRTPALRAGEKTAVAANVPIEITNKSEQSNVMRVLIVEAK
jgi:hypothetical protein